MLFYEIRAKVSEETQDRLEIGHDRKPWEKPELRDIRNLTCRYWDEHPSMALFISDCRLERLVIGAITKDGMTVKEAAHFLEALGISAQDLELAEIPFRAFRNLYENAHRNYIDHDVDLLEVWGLDGHRFSSLHEEMVAEQSEAAESLRTRAEGMVTETLVEEVGRIFAVPNAGGVIGHPVHYVIQSEDATFQTEARNLLLEALLAAGRLRSRRITTVRDEDDTELAYMMAPGGTVCINTVKLKEQSGLFRRAGTDAEDLLRSAAEEMEQHYDDVLTIIQVGKRAEHMLDVFCENIADGALVTIREGTVSGHQGAVYLKERAARQNLAVSDSLTASLEPDARYAASELNQMFSRWKKTRLKTEIYPQYSHVQCIDRSKQEEKPAGSAYAELESMIGLDDVKRELQERLDFFKAQKLFRERGFSENRPCMHMIFSGSPGTAKTSVARLVARILKDNEVLTSGHMVEVGRGALVGKYVGHTAPQVQKVFRQAEGGVLFIDEAYSLVDDRAGLYGDEAINTLVQEMENQREQVMVIFAGYTDKMEGFLHTNPGLRSRIAAHVKFPDYTAADLYRITEHLAGQSQLELAPGAEEKLLPIYERAVQVTDFGNGRYVRNMLERARMAQSARLLAMDIERVSREQVRTLIAEDFSEIPVGTGMDCRPIGFSA